MMNEASPSVDQTNIFKQDGEKYRSLSAAEKTILIEGIVSGLKPLSQDDQMKAICHYFQADAEYGLHVAKGLGLDVSGYLSASGDYNAGRQ